MIKEKIKEWCWQILLKGHCCGDYIKPFRFWKEQSEHFSGTWYEFKKGPCKLCENVITMYRVVGEKEWVIIQKI